MAAIQPINYATRPSRPSQPYYCPALPWLAEKKSMTTETVGELLVRNIKNVKDWEVKVIAGYLVDVHHMQKLPLPRKEHVGQLNLRARFVPNQVSQSTYCCVLLDEANIKLLGVDKCRCKPYHLRCKRCSWPDGHSGSTTSSPCCQ
jgi:hypothetical protein